MKLENNFKIRPLSELHVPVNSILKDFQNELIWMNRALRTARFFIFNAKHFIEDTYVRNGFHGNMQSVLLPDEGFDTGSDFVISDFRKGCTGFLLSKDMNYAARRFDSKAIISTPDPKFVIIDNIDYPLHMDFVPIVIPFDELMQDEIYFQYSTIYDPSVLKYLVMQSYIAEHEFISDYVLVSLKNYSLACREFCESFDEEVEFPYNAFEAIDNV